MSSAIKTPAFAAKAGNIQNEDNSSIYSGGAWSFKNASAVTGFHVASDGKVTIGTGNHFVGGNIGIGTAVVSGTQLGTIQTSYGLLGGRYQINLMANAYYNDGFKFIDNGVATLYAQNTGEAPGGHIWKTSASGTAGNPCNLVERMRITANGLLYSLPTYNNTSSAAVNVAIASSGEFLRSTSALKYKEDITPISFGLDTVLSMQPIEYKSKCEVDKDAEHKFIGFVADWEEANLPALVQKDREGEVEGFSYDRLTAVLCKAIQEQQAMIEELKAKVSALESK